MDLERAPVITGQDMEGAGLCLNLIDMETDSEWKARENQQLQEEVLEGEVQAEDVVRVEDEEGHEVLTLGKEGHQHESFLQDALQDEGLHELVLAEEGQHGRVFQDNIHHGEDRHPDNVQQHVENCQPNDVHGPGPHVAKCVNVDVHGREAEHDAASVDEGQVKDNRMDRIIETKINIEWIIDSTIRTRKADMPSPWLAWASSGLRRLR